MENSRQVKTNNFKKKGIALGLVFIMGVTGYVYYEHYNSESQVEIRIEQDKIEALANRIYQDYDGVEDVLSYYDFATAVQVLGLSYEYDVPVDLVLEYYDKEDGPTVRIVYMREKDANFPALDEIAREKAIEKLKEKGDEEGVERIEGLDKEENLQRILSLRKE